jgi:hypothetical protein
MIEVGSTRESGILWLQIQRLAVSERHAEVCLVNV